MSCARCLRGVSRGLTVAFMALVVFVNVAGVRMTTLLNNIGVSIEILVTIGGTLAVAVATLVASQGANDVGFLFSQGLVTDSPFLLAWFTAILAGLFGLIGAEAAADVAEETKDTRRTVPRTMLLAFAAAATVEFVMYTVFLLAIPEIGAASDSATPLTYIMEERLGAFATDVFVGLALTNIFACALANMLVVTRLVFALARDNMLPGSGFFGQVSQRFHVPANATVAVGTLSSVFVVSSLASEQALGYILGLATLAFFLVYLLTAAGLWRAVRRGRSAPRCRAASTSDAGVRRCTRSASCSSPGRCSPSACCPTTASTGATCSSWWHLAQPGMSSACEAGWPVGRRAHPRRDRVSTPIDHPSPRPRVTLQVVEP